MGQSRRALRASANVKRQPELLRQAVSIGMQHSLVRAPILIGADLKNGPARVISLYRAWQGGADVAFAKSALRASSNVLLIGRSTGSWCDSRISLSILTRR